MSDIERILQKQRDFFDNGVTRSLPFRIEKLKLLKKVVLENEKEILEALKKDLNKAPFEAYATEVGIVLDELGYIIKHLPSWAKARNVKTPVIHFPSSGYIMPEPYGISLIMSPWNYPFNLAIIPLIGSMSAGNCTVIKPSAYSANTSAVIARIIAENFDEEYISVIEGGRNENRQLLNEKFDYIFFTGSVSVGKTVMEAASKNLTPVTLELGGKSPCIVDKKVNIRLAAKRIIWGKLLNAGQTCVAPDYLLVHSDVKQELLIHMKEAITGLYGSDPCNNPEYPKIINEKHFNRLKDLLKCENIVAGGKYNEGSLKIAPTIIDRVKFEDPVMQEEIFGPIMPVLEYKELPEVIRAVNSRPKPLALYFFSTDKNNQKFIMNNISFGGGCINDTMVHIGTSSLPFGGVGESGMGGYHGRASFETFSHMKSVLNKSNLLDIKLRYAPYKNNLKLLKKILK